jgi:long-chain fatty acid transport protein
MSDHIRRGTLAAAMVSLALVPSAAHAAGFAIFEQGARAMGFAGAYTALADDPSAMFHNVAGIGFLKGTQVQLGVTAIHPTSSFVGDNPFPGAGVSEKQDVGILPPPHFYITHQLGQKAVVGLGVDVPFGLRTEWENPSRYSGRYLSTRADLGGPLGAGLAVNPSIAWKLADRLSVGGGIDFRFSRVELNRYVPTVNPFTQTVVDVAAVDLKSKVAHGVGFNLGVLGKVTENLSFGLTYRHKVKVDYTGTADFALLSTGNAQLDGLVAKRLPSGAIGVTTAIEFPSFVTSGVAYRWNTWTFSGDVNWYQWSSFDALPLTFAVRDTGTKRERSCG